MHTFRIGWLEKTHKGTVNCCMFHTSSPKQGKKTLMSKTLGKVKEVEPEPNASGHFHGLEKWLIKLQLTLGFSVMQMGVYRNGTDWMRTMR